MKRRLVTLAAALFVTGCAGNNWPTSTFDLTDPANEAVARRWVTARTDKVAADDEDLIREEIAFDLPDCEVSAVRVTSNSQVIALATWIDPRPADRGFGFLSKEYWYVLQRDRSSWRILRRYFAGASYGCG